jgi:5-formaminoimidazole-4-carboxamide-1-(beta)-D-ribofuranosyl 5'-monophosphate synthetase
MIKTIKQTLQKYDHKNIRVGVLGSHSALEIAAGAKQEGFETVVVCQKGREKTYTKYYGKLFDHTMLLDKFSEITNEKNVKQLTDLNTIFVPNRSFSVYAGYENIENKFGVPLMGNRGILRTEERNTPKNQLYLLQKAGIKTPKIFKSPKDINRLAIVKVPEKERAIERAFFYASTPEEYEKKSQERINQGIITKEALKEAVIEEYVVGAKFNANLFWSPLTDEIDLLGFDKRVQTDLDGILDLPAQEQLELKHSDPEHRNWTPRRNYAGKPN